MTAPKYTRHEFACRCCGAACVAFVVDSVSVVMSHAGRRCIEYKALAAHEFVKAHGIEIGEFAKSCATCGHSEQDHYSKTGQCLQCECTTWLERDTRLEVSK